MINPDIIDNPYNFSIIDISIQKFDGTDRLSILPQWGELNIYQSLFEPCIKGVLVLLDEIGLFDNYPLNGEERVTVTWAQEGNFNSTETSVKYLEFMITDIEDLEITPNNRSMVYKLYLTSEEMLESSRKKIAVCVYDTAAKAANTIFDEHIKIPMEERNSQMAEASKSKVQPKQFEIEDSSKVRKFIISQQHPLDGIKWLTKHAVQLESNNHTYIFYEDLDGFHFKTIEKLIKDGKIDYGKLYQDRFMYASDAQLIPNSSQLSRNLQNRGITNISFIKRISGLKKISTGYIKNEYMNVNLLQKSYTVTKVEKESTPSQTTLERFPLNTPKYFEEMKKGLEQDEKSSRIKYAINNFQPGEEPEYEKKFGNAIQNLSGLDQVEIMIAISADWSLNVGNIIWVDLGSTHGFNNIESEKYISGAYIITELKQIAAIGGHNSTVLTIARDSYLNQISETMKYTIGGGSATEPVTNPSTGEVAQ